ncbi:hypothetical protein AAFF_G00234970 [Aldrovandia affinis]|uniref:Uncharacterized protein n=1 Tax=Aldrovandia affinis TaxID=143900 RepID=A0AAD7SUY7_9TELE|nr:hypothetical protein AAFF_G00234970 [Aldrovandia affinis]
MPEVALQRSLSNPRLCGHGAARPLEWSPEKRRDSKCPSPRCPCKTSSTSRQQTFGTTIFQRCSPVAGSTQRHFNTPVCSWSPSPLDHSPRTVGLRAANSSHAGC